MSKKHFIALADALKATRPKESMIDEFTQWKLDVDAVARVCHSLNPAFKRDRWYGYIDAGNGESKP
ncbi:MAG TPA: hypothetical protein VKX49_13135 [Bryobacteraceae bacterium]|nr:hypothetical protein [Bryobacteraceae bacterium]